MTFDEYQAEARKTAIYPKEFGLGYVALGLAGEAGEVANKVKKVYRDCEGHLTDHQRGAIGMEIQDCMWYIAMLCDELGITMDQAAVENIRELKSRQERNVIHGSGDNR